jgi:hypothetical protein
LHIPVEVISGCCIVEAQFEPKLEQSLQQRLKLGPSFALFDHENPLSGNANSLSQLLLREPKLQTFVADRAAEID